MNHGLTYYGFDPSGYWPEPVQSIYTSNWWGRLQSTNIPTVLALNYFSCLESITRAVLSGISTLQCEVYLGGNHNICLGRQKFHTPVDEHGTYYSASRTFSHKHTDTLASLRVECAMAFGKADAQAALARATAVQLAQSEAAVQRADARVTELTNELADREEELSAAQRKLVSTHQS